MSGGLGDVRNVARAPGDGVEHQNLLEGPSLRIFPTDEGLRLREDEALIVVTVSREEVLLESLRLADARSQGQHETLQLEAVIFEFLVMALARLAQILADGSIRDAFHGKVRDDVGPDLAGGVRVRGSHGISFRFSGRIYHNNFIHFVKTFFS
jgi:hypothetical protein